MTERKKMQENFQRKRAIYKGICFRSKLEARWAVVFDALGIEWEYEPETFKSTFFGNGDPIYYRPDFYFPEFDKYAEVKPNDEKLFEIQDKLSIMVDYGGPLANGIIILGTIPDSTKIVNYLPAFSFLYNRKACVLGYLTFYCDELWIIDQDVDFTDACNEEIPKDTTTNCRWIRCDDSVALNIARSAYEAGWFAKGIEEVKE